MDKDELIFRNELVKSSVYSEIRKRVVNHIIESSSSNLSPDILRGMLLVVKHIDRWADDYEAELKKRKKGLEDGR